MKNLLIDGTNAVMACYFVNRKDFGEVVEDEETFLANVHNTFIMMMSNLETQFSTNNVYIAWEGPNGTKWRKEILPEYKANRGEKDPLIISALQKCKSENSYPNLTIENAEGDDIIYALCRHFKEKGDENIICSTDKDFIQAAQEGLCTVYNFTKKEFRPIPEYNSICEKALTGDTSDNLKGIPGIGPVKAQKLLKENLKGLTSEQITIYNNHVKVVGLKNNPFKEQILRDVKGVLS